MRNSDRTIVSIQSMNALFSLAIFIKDEKRTLKDCQNEHLQS